MNIKGVSAMSTLERIENLKDTECIVDMLLKEVRAKPVPGLRGKAQTRPDSYFFIFSTVFHVPVDHS